jgi:hypothetical protein
MVAGQVDQLPSALVIAGRFGKPGEALPRMIGIPAERKDSRSFDCVRLLRNLTSLRMTLQRNGIGLAERGSVVTPIVDECRVKVFNTNVHNVVEKGVRIPAK